MADPFNIGDGAKATHTGFALDYFDDFAEPISFAAIAPEGLDTPRAWMVLSAGDGTVLEVVDRAGRTRQIPGPLLVGRTIIASIQSITENTTIGAILVIW